MNRLERILKKLEDIEKEVEAMIEEEKAQAKVQQIDGLTDIESKIFSRITTTEKGNKDGWIYIKPANWLGLFETLWHVKLTNKELYDILDKCVKLGLLEDKVCTSKTGHDYKMYRLPVKPIQDDLPF